MIIFFLVFICALSIILLFTSRKLSPVPYFPSNKKDLPLILKALNLRNGQTVVDLGAGDGLVIFESAAEAQKLGLNTQFIAVEINPILILILHIKRLLNHNRRNIRIIYADMFKFNVSRVIAIRQLAEKQSLTIYLYISPWYMEKVYKKLKKELKFFKLVSYFYHLKNTKAVKTLRGRNKIFVY